MSSKQLFNKIHKVSGDKYSQTVPSKGLPQLAAGSFYTNH